MHTSCKSLFLQPSPTGRVAGGEGNDVEISRHSGMDRRNPDCMDASSSDHPWSLGSGAPPAIPDRGRLCRNDEINLNSTALGGEGDQQRRCPMKSIISPHPKSLSRGKRDLCAYVSPPGGGLGFGDGKKDCGWFPRFGAHLYTQLFAGATEPRRGSSHKPEVERSDTPGG